MANSIAVYPIGNVKEFEELLRYERVDFNSGRSTQKTVNLTRSFGIIICKMAMVELTKIKNKEPMDSIRALYRKVKHARPQRYSTSGRISRKSGCTATSNGL